MIGSSSAYLNNVYGPAQAFEGYWSGGNYTVLTDLTGARGGTPYMQDIASNREGTRGIQLRSGRWLVSEVDQRCLGETWLQDSSWCGHAIHCTA